MLDYCLLKKTRTETLNVGRCRESLWIFCTAGKLGAGFNESSEEEEEFVRNVLAVKESE